jgi:hypothetical protein
MLTSFLDGASRNDPAAAQLPSWKRIPALGPQKDWMLNILNGCGVRRTWAETVC